MRKSDLLKLAFLNIKGQKFKSIIYILILTIFSTMIFCFFSGKNSFLGFVNDLLNSNYELKMIAINTEKQDKDKIYNEVNKIKNNHIAQIYYDNYEIRNTADLVEYNGGINIYGISKGYDFVLDKGEYIKNDDEMICSNLFNLNNWSEVHNVDEYHDMNKEIGKYFNITYDKYLRIDKEKTEILKTYNHKVKLVGTFDTNKTLIGYDVCFVSKAFFEQIKEEQKTVYKDSKLEEEAHSGLELLILVDKYNNVEKVLKDLKKLGYDAYQYYTVDLDFYNTILLVINIASIAIIFISIIVIYLFVKNTLLGERKNIALYKLLGFDDNNISLIFLGQYIINTITSFILSIIITNLIKIIISNILLKDPNYSILIIFISYGEGIIYMLLVIIIVIVIILFLFKNNIRNSSPMKLMEGSYD